MKNITSKCKLCRREGTKLFLRGDRCQTAKCAIVKRNFPPGLHGPKAAGGRMTDYGKQLREKQKAKRIYGLIERQFRNYFDLAVSQKGDTGPKIYYLLEQRLDSVVYRAGFGKSMSESRQLVNHGHFLVNGKKVTIPSYQLKVNDVVTIKPKSLKQKSFCSIGERIQNRQVPEWLFLDTKEVSIKLIDVPDPRKMALPFDIKAIIEFYSR